MSQSSAAYDPEVIMKCNPQSRRRRCQSSSHIPAGSGSVASSTRASRIHRYVSVAAGKTVSSQYARTTRICCCRTSRDFIDASLRGGGAGGGGGGGGDRVNTPHP